MSPIYSRCPDFVQREVAGECLLVPIRRALGEANSIYVLNEVAAGFWRLIDGKRTLVEIVDGLLAEYDVERARLEGDLAVLAADLLSIKAIAAAP